MGRVDPAVLKLWKGKRPHRTYNTIFQNAQKAAARNLRIAYIRKSSNHVHSRYPPASLMGLPVELRQTILQHALAGTLPSDRVPPIFHVSGQLCLEAEYPFLNYTRPHEIEVQGDTLKIMSETYSLEGLFPPTRDTPRNFTSYAHIEEVKLVIRRPGLCCDCEHEEAYECWPHSCELKACWRRYKDGIRRAVMFLKALSGLRRLEIVLDYPPECIEDSEQDWDREGQIFLPFHTMRGLDSVDVRLQHERGETTPLDGELEYFEDEVSCLIGITTSIQELFDHVFDPIVASFSLQHALDQALQKVRQGHVQCQERVCVAASTDYKLESLKHSLWRIADLEDYVDVRDEYTTLCREPVRWLTIAFAYLDGPYEL